MSQAYVRYQVDRPGPPEVMRWATEPVRHAAAGEVRVRHEAIGVDFIDTRLRSGPMPAALPTGLGFAAVGIAEAVCPGVQLREAARAHHDLVSGRTAGSVVFLP